MESFQGYFDGVNIRPLEHIPAKPNQRVVITVMNEFVEPDKTARAEDVFGMLSEYANPALIEKEKTAWEDATVREHAHT